MKMIAAMGRGGRIAAVGALLGLFSQWSLAEPVSFDIKISGVVRAPDSALTALEEAGFAGLHFADDQSESGLGAVCMSGNDPVLCSSGERVPVQWHDGVAYILYDEYLKQVSSQVSGKATLDQDE